jgi:hypothetical protein
MVVESVVHNVNGTCTWSCAVAAVVSAGATPGLLIEGSNWYFINVNLPSGRTNESVFDCVKQFRLSNKTRRDRTR